MELEAMDKIENVPSGELAELILKGLTDEVIAGMKFLMDTSFVQIRCDSMERQRFYLRGYSDGITNLKKTGML